MAVTFPFLIPEPFARAVFVAALVLAAFALFRYRQSLEGVARRLQLLLITLRATALLLLVCALAGVRVEYETNGEARVLVRQASAERGRNGETTARMRDEEAGVIIDALKKQSFAVIESTATVESAATGDRRAIDDGSFVAGVMLTEGAMTADEAVLEVERLKAATGGAPVFVVAHRQQTGPTVALESVAMGSRSVRGVPVAVRCVVHGRGMRGRESLVTIADEAKVQASARVVWTNDDEWRALTLPVVPKVVGWMSYTARVEAAGGEDAGTLGRSFSLNVLERRWRVLFFEGEPTWEAKFIRRALEQSALFEVDYFAQVSRAAAVGATEDTSEQKEGRADAQGDVGVHESKPAAAGAPEAKLHAALASAERLNNYDCIIVGATPDGMLSGAEAARLSSWTEKRGGGLVILGGNSFAGSIVAPAGKLYRLMPASIDARGFASEMQQQARGVPLEAEKAGERLTLLPTTAGAETALGAYLNTLQATATQGGTLTGQGLRLGALRPGASVLAVAARGGAPATSETGTPLIAAARYGAGRTLLFAPADSWRLRTTTMMTTRTGGEQDESNTPYNALWQGLLLWATAGARPPVEITLSDNAPAAGRRLTAEIRVRDATTFAPAEIEKLNARLQPLTENGEASTGNFQPREIAFVPDENDRSVWRASLDVLAPGPYSLEADFIANGKSGSALKQFAVVAPFNAETGAALDTLSRAARETGGMLLTGDDEASELVALINATPFNPATTRRTWELRTWWPLAFILPLLLSAAWLIERMKQF